VTNDDFGAVPRVQLRGGRKHIGPLLLGSRSLSIALFAAALARDRLQRLVCEQRWVLLWFLDGLAFELTWRCYLLSSRVVAGSLANLYLFLNHAIVVNPSGSTFGSLVLWRRVLALL
jgi:hypothetical protein